MKSETRTTSSYIKSIFQLMTGAFFAQLITVIVAPISTRLYTPEQLGIYTLIITILSIFGPIISGKYDLAIVSAEDDREVMELIVASFFTSILFTALVTVGYKFYLMSHPEITNEVGGWAYLIVTLLIISGSANILSSYNNRNKEYEIISSVYVIRTAIQNLGLVLFGLLKLGSTGLLLSQFISSIFGLKKQGERLFPKRYMFKTVTLRGVWNSAVKYKKQPLYSMPAHFVNSASYSLLNFFISGLFGMESFGYYSMSYRILGLPLSLISSNVSKVFFQRASEEKMKVGNYRRTLKQMTFLLTGISIPMVLGLFFLGPYMFELAFGKGWYMSGVFVRILAPMYGFRFIVSALTPALIVSNRQGLELLVQCLFILSSVCAFFITKVFNFDIGFFLTLISVMYSVIYAILYFIIYRLSK